MIFESDEYQHSHRITPAYIGAAAAPSGTWSNTENRKVYSLQRVGGCVTSLVSAGFVGDPRTSTCPMCRRVQNVTLLLYEFEVSGITKIVATCWFCAETYTKCSNFVARNDMLYLVADTEHYTAMLSCSVTTDAAPVTRIIDWSDHMNRTCYRDRPLTRSSPGGDIFHIMHKYTRTGYSTVWLCDLLSEKPTYREIYREEYMPSWCISACMRDNQTCCMTTARVNGRRAVVVDLRSGDCIDLDTTGRLPKQVSAAFASENICVILDIGYAETAVDMRMPGVVIHSVENTDGTQIA